MIALQHLGAAQSVYSSRQASGGIYVYQLLQMCGGQNMARKKGLHKIDLLLVPHKLAKKI